MTDYRNLAFISYKREDEQWAKWLQKTIENYQLPVEVRQQNIEFAEKPRHVFKDTTDLSGGVLEKAIKDGLDSSKFLIVICSPRAAMSPWVCKEVQTFIDAGKSENIIPFIIEGEPHSKNESQECFPEALRCLSGEQELLGININENGRDAAAVKVMARMFDLQFDSLWQRFKRAERKRRNQIITLVSCLVISVIVVAGYIYSSNRKLVAANWKIQQNLYKSAKSEAEYLSNKNDLYRVISICLGCLPEDMKNPDRPVVNDMKTLLRQSAFALFVNSGKVARFDVRNYHNNDEMDYGVTPDGEYVWAEINDTLNIYDTKTMTLLHRRIPIEDNIGTKSYCFFDGLLACTYQKDANKYAEENFSKIRLVSGIGNNRQEILMRIENGISIVVDDEVDKTEYSRTDDSISMSTGGVTISVDNTENNAEPQRKIVLWDVETGEIVRESEYSENIKDVSFFDYSQIMYCQLFNSIWIIDDETLLPSYELQTGSVVGCASNEYVIGKNSKKLYIAQLKNGGIQKSFEVGEHETISDITYNDSLAVMFVSNDKPDKSHIDIIDIKSQARIKTMSHDIGDSRHLLISPGSKYIFIDDIADNRACCIEVDSGEKLSFSMPARANYECKFSEDDELVILLGDSVTVCNLENGDADNGSLSDFYTDCDYFVKRDGTSSSCYLYQVDPALPEIMTVKSDPLTTSFEPYKQNYYVYASHGEGFLTNVVQELGDGMYLVLDYDKEIVIYNSKTEDRTVVDVDGITEDGNCLLAYAEEKGVAYIATASAIFNVDIESATVSSKIEIPLEGLEYICVDARGDNMYVRLNKTDNRIYNTKDYEGYITINEEVSINPLFSPSSRYFAAFLHDGSLCLFDTQTGEKLWAFSDTSFIKGMNRICFSTDEDYIYAVDNNEIYCLDTDSGSVYRKYAESSDVTCIAVNNDNILAYATEQGVICFRDVENDYNTMEIQNDKFKSCAHIYWENDTEAFFSTDGVQICISYLSDQDIRDLCYDLFSRRVNSVEIKDTYSM